MPLPRPQKKPTDGERARIAAYGLVGISSAAFGYLAVLHLDQASLFDGLSWYQFWIILASGLGGLIALYLSGDKMGQPGLRGALRSIAGSIWLTFTGALIGGTLALPLYGTMFGPFILFVTMAGAPVILGVWICNLIALHLLLRVYQRERDSIFARPEQAFPAHSERLTIPLRRRLT